MGNHLEKIIKEKVEKPFLLKFKPTKEFYEKVEISSITFWKLYRNEKQPNAKQINKLCEFFDIKIGELIELPKQGRLFNVIPALKINRETVLHLEHFSKKLDENQQTEFNQIIKNIKNEKQ